MKWITFLLIPVIGFCQVQIGSSIIGEFAEDYSGENVAISFDGTTVAIASRYNNSYSGHVRIFENVLGSWVQVGNDLDGAASDFFGSGLAITGDGNIVAVGSTDNIGAGAGKVRIYQNIANEWILQGDIDGEAPGDAAEIVSLSSDGSTLAIGAPFNDAVQDAGHVRVYKNIAGTWVQHGQDIDGQYSNDQFGSAISLSGDGTTVAIGAQYHSNIFYNGGYAQVFRYNEGQWVQIGQNIYGQQVYDLAGKSISLSEDGNTLGVAAPYNSTNGTYSGKVRIFKIIENVWEQKGQDILGSNYDNFFGSSMSFSADGETIAISSPQNSDIGFRFGKAEIFKYSVNSWYQLGTDILGQNVEDYFGSAISLSGNAETVAISAYQNDEGGENAGQVRVYDLSGVVLKSESFLPTVFSLHPNPVKSILNIHLSSDTELEKVNVYNNLGQLVLTQSNKIIDVTSLSTGLFIAEVITDKGKSAKSFIIE